MNDKLKIRHIPYGVDCEVHDLCGRFPADPMPGEKIIIRALVNNYDEIYLKYKINDCEQKIKKASALKSSRDIRFCEFKLDSLSQDDRVTYTFFALDGEATIYSKEYSFNTTIETTLDSIKGVKISDNKILISFDNRNNDYNIAIYFNNGMLRIIGFKSPSVLGIAEGCTIENLDKYSYLLVDNINGSKVQIGTKPFRIDIKNKKGKIVLSSDKDQFLKLIQSSTTINSARVGFYSTSKGYYGFGERFDSFNQIGLSPDINVFEKFGSQQDKTYMPVPFFIASNGFGIYSSSSRYIKYSLDNGEVTINQKIGYDNENFEFNLYIIFGKPKDIINQYYKITGMPKLPPKWSFGLWMSSNRWNTQKMAEEQFDLTNKYKIPASVMVLEAWSDETTFYIFNDTIYKAKPGKEALSFNDFKFNAKWSNPKELVDKLHKNNIKLVLWQIPVIKFFKATDNKQHINDEEYAIENKYCVMNEDGTPYRITDNWFMNSLILDFTNPEAVKWWFNKRRYLIDDVGVDGFKTDGGEFVYEDSVIFSNGKKGSEMRNSYPVKYVESYHGFMDGRGVTFSRAGFAGAQTCPIYWAGDQFSTFEQLRCVLNAGLSSSISGIPFWSYDIGGFSGKIPCTELYIRSTQMAVFSPIMQYHSEPNFEYNNDRTPWNVASYNDDDRVIELFRMYANLRMNLIPYILQEADNATENGEILMRPIIYDFPDDENVLEIDDQYMFGRNVLVAPVLKANKAERSIYLPEGNWMDFWDGTLYNGGKIINYSCPLSKIPVFIKENTIVPLNLNNDIDITKWVSNDIGVYKNLCFLVNGSSIDNYCFKINKDSSIQITYQNNKLCVLRKNYFNNIYIITLDKFNSIVPYKVKGKFNIYKVCDKNCKYVLAK